MKLNSRELKDFFVGCLLGDGNIHNGTFGVKQISKDLIDFKADIIKSHLPGAIIKIYEYESYVDKNGVKHQKYWDLRVSKSEYIKKLFTEFYPHGKKIIPEKYIRKLSLIGLAIWYADDGTTILVQYNRLTGSAKCRRVQLCTDNFSVNEVCLIKNIFEKYDFDCSIVKRKEHQVRLQVNGFSSQRFIQTISDYFYKYFPSLLYKMDLGYRNKSLENRNYVSEDYHKLYLKISAHTLFVDRLANRV